MATIKLRYVQQFKDRHGKVRYYYRRAGFKHVALPGVPGSAEFMAAYQQASADKTKVGGERTKPGSLSALVVAYYESMEFKSLNPKTQSNYKGIFDRFRKDYGDWPVRGLELKHIRAIMDQRAATPGAAKNLLKRLRMLLSFAVDRGWRDDNPAVNAKPPRATSHGFRPWEEEDIEAFIKRWPPGTREYLALMLLLYTGQRRSDAVRMGRQHIRDGLLRVDQVKGSTGPRPVHLAIPLHPKLKEALDATPKDNLTFLMTQQGKPFSEAGFTKWFGQRAQDAGLPAGCTPHGLRKAAARRLAEAGCTPHQIGSITGHRSLKEVEHYTQSANQPRLAKGAMAALIHKS